MRNSVKGRYVYRRGGLPKVELSTVPALGQTVCRCAVRGMTPIERAARALCKCDGQSDDGKRKGEPLWQSYVPQVRAVLDAIHEPSLRMAEFM